jgi:hypothetical protein
MSACKNPDNAKSDPIPIRVDPNTFFFGSCKKPLRRMLKSTYLAGRDYVQCRDDLFLVGLNSAGRNDTRKIIWAGKIRDFMTFEYAWNNLNSSSYSVIKRMDQSPITVKPEYEMNDFMGYSRNYNLHPVDNAYLRSRA